MQLFWTTQLLGIVALAGAKLSIVLMFQRIDPIKLGRTTMKWLTPMVGIYMLVGLFLVAFQCKLPRPWVLSLDRCPMREGIYLTITMFNILTDTVLSLWILPELRKLQLRRHTKNLVMWLFVSRFIVCIADMGRIAVIHRALPSEDHTRKPNVPLLLISFPFLLSNRRLPGFQVPNSFGP